MATSKSTKSPAFQFYVNDFLLSRRVRRMSMTERGVYITLLAMSWGEGGLPTNLDDLAADCSMKAEQFRRMWERGPLHECFIERNGRLVNPRLEVERRKQAEYRRKMSDNGAKGGRPGKASGLPQDTEPKPDAKPSSLLSSSPLDSSPLGLKDSAEPRGDSTPVVMSFPVVGNPQQPTWSLHQSRIDQLGEAFPNLDVEAQCRLAMTWAQSNPSKRKTAKGMPAFLFNWMTTAVNRGGGASRPVAAGSRTTGNVEALQRFANRGRTA